jgi:hypothetical protein
MTHWRFAALLVGCGLLGACSDAVTYDCTADLRYNMIIEVRDSVTGEPAALGATGSSWHQESGSAIEIYGRPDPLRLVAIWTREQPGSHWVSVVKPGYRPVEEVVTVTRDGCHVRTEHVSISLAPDPSAVPVTPLSLERGARVGGSPASAGIRVFGDTLLISGRAATGCREIDAVAFRSAQSWHVQLQPSQWTGPCSGPSDLQQFEVRYRLPAGRNDVLVTHGHGPPVRLFSGTVLPH